MKTATTQPPASLQARLDELYFLRGLLRFSRRPTDQDLDRRIAALEMQLGYCPVEFTNQKERR